MKLPRSGHRPLATAWKIAAARFGGRRVPLVVNLSLTHRCSLRCSYCAVWENPPDEMDTRTLLVLIDEVADAGCERLSLGGGEPMLRGDVGLLVGHARRRGLAGNLSRSYVSPLFTRPPPSFQGRSRSVFHAPNVGHPRLALLPVHRIGTAGFIFDVRREIRSTSTPPVVVFVVNRFIRTTKRFAACGPKHCF